MRLEHSYLWGMIIGAPSIFGPYLIPKILGEKLNGKLDGTSGITYLDIYFWIPAGICDIIGLFVFSECFILALLTGLGIRNDSTMSFCVPLGVVAVFTIIHFQKKFIDRRWNEALKAKEREISIASKAAGRMDIGVPIIPLIAMPLSMAFSLCS